MNILRFAPSPTGYLHLGNTRTLLINYLLSSQLNAYFILRFDDTDQLRCKPEFEQQILNDLRWLNIRYDNIVKQSERNNLYHSSIAKLKENGFLYPCFETKEELDFKRKQQLAKGQPPLYDRSALKLSDKQITHLIQEGIHPHWRFKIDPAEISWNDQSHGRLSFVGEHLSDPVVIRADGTPLFTLVGIIDDIDMKITHIVRGDDHITNTAVQLKIAQALGAEAHQFTFAHIPLVQDSTGSGLSKRLGSLSLKDLQEQGYEPFAVINYLVTLGLGEKPLSTVDYNSIINQMDLKRLGKSSPKFSLEDLKRANGNIVHHLPFEHVQSSYPQITEDFWRVVQGNLNFVDELGALIEICYGTINPIISDKALMQHAQDCLPPAPLTQDTWSKWTHQLSTETGLKGKALSMPLRLAITGQEYGPEMKKLLPYIAYDKVVGRLQGKLI